MVQTKGKPDRAPASGGGGVGHGNLERSLLLAPKQKVIIILGTRARIGPTAWSRGARPAGQSLEVLLGNWSEGEGQGAEGDMTQPGVRNTCVGSSGEPDCGVRSY